MRTGCAIVAVLFILIVGGGLSCGGPPERPDVRPTSCRTIPLAQASCVPGEQGRVVLEINDIAVTKTSMRVDYQVTNLLPHDIWVGEVAWVNARPSAVIVETRITDTILHIDFRFDIPQSVAMEGIFAKYRRFPPGQARSRTVVLDVPVRDTSYSASMYAIEYAPAERQVVLDRLIFEVGFFEEDLSELVSASLNETGLWRPRPEDPDVVFVPHWWKGLNLEHSVQASITDVNIAAHVPAERGY